MYTKIIPPPALNHQGGWDEMLMFLVPALLLTWLRNKQKNENTENRKNETMKNTKQALGNRCSLKNRNSRRKIATRVCRKTKFSKTNPNPMKQITTLESPKPGVF